MELGAAATPLPSEIEEGVIERAKTGEPQALGAIYDWYLPRVYRYVLSRVGNVTEAEDLTEDVFLRMLGAITDYRKTGVPFSAWLFRIARNHLVSHYRKNGVRKGQETLDEGMTDSRHDPAAIVETQMMIGEVALAVQRLPEAQRDVIALRFAGGLSIAETAQVLGKRQGNVKTLQHKAVLKLQRMLRPDAERITAEEQI